ncbi:DUF397 domain-containing protein [Streptomyces sp. A3M-1-3]|uniref:DUF397 domain-containing protein n=1 Tax=Streptomyces sp. A3M-1-3 TaxID=2962044 RepID=UPI0020B88BC0|nr:DUF397 domain-containing protein [Streptomyces sp. A3M-1-3]MCP3818848.1 DUF397 domain-containing protein [Streptomyces sp. A3M-1-3]
MKNQVGSRLDGAGVVWRKSSYSGAQGDCVDVARFDDVAAIRDSKDPRGPVLAFEATTWDVFVADVKRGGFPSV